MEFIRASVFNNLICTVHIIFKKNGLVLRRVRIKFEIDNFYSHDDLFDTVKSK